MNGPHGTNGSRIRGYRRRRVRPVWAVLGLLAVALVVGCRPKPTIVGCCSYHGGVYGCRPDGAVLCLDGEPSPTCTCHHKGREKKP
jgi:hypothetical protein